MGPDSAVDVLYRRELNTSPGRRTELVELYRREHANPYLAAERGYIDDVIDPATTRTRPDPEPRDAGDQATGNPGPQTRQHPPVNL